MLVPTIFNPQPSLRISDSRALRFSNDAVLRSWLQSPRKPDDLKRAVLVELERDAPRQPMIHKLLVALQKAERLEINKLVAKHLSKKS